MKLANLEALRLASALGRQLEGNDWHAVRVTCSRYPDDADPWLGQEIETLSRLAAGVASGSIAPWAGGAVGPGSLAVSLGAALGDGEVVGNEGELNARLRQCETALAAVNVRLAPSTDSIGDSLAGATYPFEQDPALAVDEELRRRRRRKVVATSLALPVGLAIGVVALVAGIGRDSSTSAKDPVVLPEATVPEAVPASSLLFPEDTSSAPTSAPDTAVPETSEAQTTTSTELASTTTEDVAFSPDVDRYLSALATFSTAGSEQMKMSSEYLSPAWSYAHQLQKSLAANPRLEGTSASVKPIAPGHVEFCLPSQCWTISGITEDYLGRISDFELDGRPMSQIVKAWDGDGDGACWIVVSGSDCASEQAGLIRLASIYSLTSTYVSVDVTAGSQLSTELTYVSARLRTADGREFTSTAFAGESVFPGDAGTWGLRFDAVLPANVASMTITVRWEGGVNDWDIEID